jgi:hypothetical protein
MRAFEFLAEDRQERLTLRQLHDMKNQSRRRARLNAERIAVVQMMYRDRKLEQEALELERARIEVAQLHAELAKTQAETRNLELESLAQSLEDREHIAKMARSAMRQRKTGRL